MKHALIVFLLCIGISASSQTLKLAAGGTLTKTLSADTSNATTSLIGTPLQFTVAKNTSYIIEGQLLAGSSASTGIKIAFNVPSGSVVTGSEVGSKATVDTLGVVAVSDSAASASAFNLYNGQTGVIFPKVKIDIGSTAGTIILQFSKPTSGTATLRKFSYLTIRKVYN